MAQKSGTGAKIFGFPVEGFSLFQSLLLAFASAFLAFFAVTCAAIFSLLAWNTIGGHTVSYAASYRYAGFPAGVVVLAVGLPFFLVVWLRAKRRK